MAKKQTSTRNTAFNYYTDNGTFYSSADITATKTTANITLLDYNKSIKKSGAEIIADAKNNKTLPNIVINTDNINEGTAYYIYGTPHKLVLDNRQQYNNCGIDSTLNVLVMAGMATIKNQNSTETAFTKQLWSLGMAEDDGVLGKFDFYDGGTEPTSYKEIFAYYGIDSKAYATRAYANCDVDGLTINLKSVANAVRNGGAAILAVDADLLWGKENPRIMINHAITVTGVVYDTTIPTDETVPVGFYIHDTGAWMTRYISYAEMEKITFANRTDIPGKSITGVMGTVITENIKQATDNINATGTKYDNTLTGNSGNNTLKGLGGADILIGSTGNDKLYGGDGSDIIFGNGVLKDNLADITDETIKSKIQNLDYIKNEEDDKKLVGRNIIDGGNGNDYIYGGYYNDTITGGNGNDYIRGGSGTDVIKGGNGNDIIYGENGNDTIYGNNGNDTIYGGDDDDVMFGGAGNDSFWGGAGSDKVSCGSGNDNVYYEENFGTDYLLSSSGSVILNFTDKEITDFEFSMSGKTFIAKYDIDNVVNYTTFYNKSENTYQKAYIKDKTLTAYRLATTNAQGNVKVASKTGNNIFISQSKKNNKITTSTGNDIIYTIGGNDTLIYSGGKDYYFSSAGNDYYKANSFNTDTFLSITDSSSNNDKLYINTENDYLRLFFDVRWNGESAIISEDYDLYFVNSEVEDFAKILSDETTGFVEVNKFFGDGNIETVATKDDVLDINASVEAIAQEVANWLINHTDYSTAFESIINKVDGYEDLIAVYANASWNIQ